MSDFTGSAAAELAVHMAAAAQGADAAALTDSAAFMTQVVSLGPDSVGFMQRVSAAVRDATAANSAYRLPTQATAPAAVPAGTAAAEEPVPLTRNERLAHQASRRAELTRDYDGPITERDVQDADPAVVGQWVAAGKLTHLGCPPAKNRYRR